MILTRAVLLSLGLTALGPAVAADLDTSYRGALWSKDQDLSGNRGIETAQLWLRGSDSTDIGDVSLRFHGEGWLSWKGGGGGKERQRSIRQAYGQYSEGAFELRAGWQIYAWGRADGINPTDNLTPRNYSLLVRDPDDQRLGIPSIKATWYSGPVSTSLIWPVGFKPSLLPWPASAPAKKDVTPDGEARQFAVRVELIRDEFEGSLTYFDGYSDLPSQVSYSPGDMEPLLFMHDRLRIAGMDFAKPIGRVILRGESAYSDSPGANSGSIFALKPQLYSVISGEETFGEYLDVEIQYYYRKVDGSAIQPSVPADELALAQEFATIEGQYDTEDQGFTARVADQWYNETLEVSLSTVFSVMRSGALFKPMVKYKVADGWTVTVGAVVATGSEHSPYGILKPDNAVYLELRRGF